MNTIEFAYDLHIHTAASPCGDDYMSPNNIINMAKLKGLDIIAITDHNTCSNCEVVMKIGQDQDILVIPGMEIECMEEFHCIALFPTLEAAKKVEKIVQENLPPMKNRIDIFGHQSILDEEDEVIGEIENFLITAVQLPISEIVVLVREVGGVIYPAHIDKNAYSILSNLGEIPEELGFTYVELSRRASKDYKERYQQYGFIQSSDAHYLQDLSNRENFFSLEVSTIEAIFEILNKKV